MPTESKPDTDMLYEQAACGLLLTDADGLILRVNQTLCRWLGYASNDLVSKRRVQDLLTIGGKIFHQTHWAPLLKMQGSVAEVKLEFIHSSGEPIPMMMNAISDSFDADIYHQIALFIATDRHKYERELLAARKNAEEVLQVQLAAQRELALVEARFRNAVEAAQLHIWHFDAQTETRHFDGSVRDLLGIDETQEISDDIFLQSIHPEDREREALSLNATVDAGAAGSRITYRLNGKDGVQRTVLSASRAVFDNDGTLLQVIGILQDITDQARRSAEAEDRALFAEQMIGIVSHDLRNPLSVILSGTEMLSRIGLNPDQTRVVQRIKRAGDRAHRLISDLLDFTVARLGSGLHIGRQMVDLHSLVSDSIEELKLAFPNYKIEHRETGTGLCEIDPDRLVQVLGNLVANAIAYGSSTEAITISTTVETEVIFLKVHNFGEPIRADLVDTLFKPMTRGVDAPSGAKSVGLGLFIVQEIVSAHGGEITVTSSAESGTTFSISLPGVHSSVAK
ncbi:MAG: PAS domain S-box protein [Herminiimonas sp.]|uniref:sensor histidine kinase n=1 Tax=Herminiimonas sp. TaxID=1926289 RepID=UPI002720E4BB|nr:sensor histidine kinase [Herminiimonas sp.]MDO9420311.1 PAS domain S-box protein [Herminiimonas sp.]